MSLDKIKYNEMKRTTFGLIEKARGINPELGKYLEKHISMDDNSCSLMYTGDPKILADLVEENS